MSNRRVVAPLGQSSDDAFSQLYVRYYQSICDFCRRRVGAAAPGHVGLRRPRGSDVAVHGGVPRDPSRVDVFGSLATTQEPGALGRTSAFVSCRRVDNR